MKRAREMGGNSTGGGTSGTGGNKGPNPDTYDSKEYVYWSDAYNVSYRTKPVVGNGGKVYYYTQYYSFITGWRYFDIYDYNPQQMSQSKGLGDSNKTPCANISEFKSRYGTLIEEYAKELGIDPNVLGAIFFTESSGGGFYDNGKLKIRFEDHIFYNSWAGTNGKYKEYFIHSSTDYSLEAFLLDGVWINTHSNQPITEYQAFELAKSLDEKAAYNAISMGFGQQMGFNYAVCGYDSAKAMFDDYSKGELQQIVGTINFIKNYDNGACLKALQNNDYDVFGLKYNGSSGYSKKIQTNIENYKNTK